MTLGHRCLHGEPVMVRHTPHFGASKSMLSDRIEHSGFLALNVRLDQLVPESGPRTIHPIADIGGAGSIPESHGRQATSLRTFAL